MLPAGCPSLRYHLQRRLSPGTTPRRRCARALEDSQFTNGLQSDDALLGR